MNFKAEDFNDEYRQQITRKLAMQDRATFRAGNAKQSGRDALDKKAEVPRFHSPVHIEVTVHKHGSTWDADNIDSKSCIDGLVASGIISNDTIKEVPTVTRQGIQASKDEQEKTVIDVYQKV